MGSGLLSLIKDFVLSVWEERKVRLYGEHANVHQSHSQNDSGDGELGCLYGKAGTSHLRDGSAHSSGCVVNDVSVCLLYVCNVCAVCACLFVVYVYSVLRAMIARTRPALSLTTQSPSSNSFWRLSAIPTHTTHTHTHTHTHIHTHTHTHTHTYTHTHTHTHTHTLNE